MAGSKDKRERISVIGVTLVINSASDPLPLFGSVEAMKVPLPTCRQIHPSRSSTSKAFRSTDRLISKRPIKSRSAGKRSPGLYSPAFMKSRKAMTVSQGVRNSSIFIVAIVIYWSTNFALLVKFCAFLGLIARKKCKFSQLVLIGFD